MVPSQGAPEKALALGLTPGSFSYEAIQGQDLEPIFQTRKMKVGAAQPPNFQVWEVQIFAGQD